MKAKKIILISILGVLFLSVLITLVVFISNMNSFQSQLTKSLDVDKLCVSCESKYYSKDYEEEDTEFELSSCVMYYKANENGSYDIKCGDLSIFDNVLYHNAIGPYLGSGSKAELTEQESLSLYDEYFQSATKYIDESKATLVPMHNYVAVTKALKEHKTLFTTKSIKGDKTEYKLYFGKAFYKDAIKYVQGGTLIDFNKPMEFPVVIKFKNDKLTKISIKFNATIEFFISLGSLSKLRGTNYYEYNLYYDYETEFSPTDEQKEYPYSFYQNYEPKNVVNLSAIDFRSMKFHNGKLYLIPIQYTNNRYTLDIYDLKTGALIKKVDLPQNAYNVFDIVLRGDCVYVRVDPNNENKVFCYNEKTEQSTLYNLPATQIFFVDDELVIVENGKKISCGNDWDSLVQTSKYDNASWFYYDHYSGNTYTEIEIDEKNYLVKLTKDGFSNNKIPLPTSGYEFDFTQEGVIVREKLEYDQYGQYTHSKYFLYDSNLEKVKEWEIEFFDADYLGETAEYIFYTSFVIDKKTGKYYGFEVDIYKRYVIFDGVLYFNNDSSLFSTETLSIKNNY